MNDTIFVSIEMNMVIYYSYRINPKTGYYDILICSGLDVGRVVDGLASYYMLNEGNPIWRKQRCN